MNTESSKTSEAHILILKLAYKIDLRRAEKIIALSNLSIYYTWKNIKGSYNNNKSKITAPTLNNKFELPDFCHLQKTWVKIQAINMVKSYLIVLKNMQRMQ